MNTESLWAIERSTLEAMALFLQRGGAKVPHAFLGVKNPGEATISGRTAVVPIQGVISYRLSWIEELFGGTSSDTIAKVIRALGNDGGVKNIVLDIHSPGGEVYGVAELAAVIRDVGQSKKIVAVANAVAASAAYWIGSQAREFAVTESGRVGSIGVINSHYDWSKALEQMGVKATIITSSSAPRKGDGSPEFPLSAEANDEMQRLVDYYEAMFIKDVAAGRGATENKVRTTFGQGGMVTASQAKELGMVDRVAGREKVLGKLVGDTAKAEADISLLGLDAVIASL